MDTDISVWDIITGQCRTVVTDHTSLVGFITLSHNNLVSASADATVRISDLETGQVKQSLGLEGRNAITCVHHDGIKVVYPPDSNVHIHNLRAGSAGNSDDSAAYRELNPHGTFNGVWQLITSGRWCVAATNNQKGTFLQVWDFSKPTDPVDQW
jgi:F-box and WD-40 domain protein CDC4